MIENDVEYSRMRAVEDAHWWYRCLHRRTRETLEKSLLDRDVIQVFDAGCGTGGLIRCLQASGMQVEGIDISQAAVDVCRQEGLNVRQLDVMALNEQEYAGQYDAVVCHDMLYFIDAAAWQDITGKFAHMLRPGGILLMNLPHGSAFAGTHDHAVGIARRFEYSDLAQIFSPQIFILESVTFWPVMLSPLVYTVRLLQRVRHRLAPVDNPVSDIDIPGNIVNRILGLLGCIDSALLNRLRLASSMFVVLRKSGDGSLGMI